MRGQVPFHSSQKDGQFSSSLDRGAEKGRFTYKRMHEFVANKSLGVLDSSDTNDVDRGRSAVFSGDFLVVSHVFGNGEACVRRGGGGGVVMLE